MRRPSTIKGLLAALGAFAFALSAHAQERILVNALGTNPPHFNRLLSTEIATAMVGSTIYETLVRIDSSYTPIPSLATAWQSNANATEYKLTLREGVKWHDGKPFTSDDVKFTFDTYLKLAPFTATYAALVQEVTAPDAKTVVVKFKSPFAPFIEALASVWILPKHVFGDGRDVSTHPANSTPIGTGPFKFQSFRSANRVVAVRYQDYWGPKTDVETMVFPVIPDSNARTLALESGNLHYSDFRYVDKSAYPRLLKDSRFAALPHIGALSVITAHMNTVTGPLAKYEVRKAVYQALDRGAIAQRAYYGYAVPARGAIPAKMSWAVSSDVDYNKDLPHDIATAAALLDGAGYPVGSDGTRFTLTLAYPSAYPAMEATASVMQSNLAQVGIKVNLVGEDFQVWTQRVFKAGDYSLAIIFYSTFEDPNLGIARAYVCNPNKAVYRNASGLCDEQLDALFVKAGATADREQRRAAFSEAEKRIEQLLHTVPLVVEEQYNFGRKDLWDLEQASATYPTNWSLVKAHK